MTVNIQLSTRSRRPHSIHDGYTNGGGPIMSTNIVRNP